MVLTCDGQRRGACRKKSDVNESAGDEEARRAKTEMDG